MLTAISTKRRCGMKSSARFLVGLFVLLLASSVSALPPTLVTDKPVYAAGENVTFRGEGWVPGEPVVLVITPEGGGEATTLRTTADDDGEVNLTVTLPGEGKGFHVTATGRISRISTQAQFSEGVA